MTKRIGKKEFIEIIAAQDGVGSKKEAKHIVDSFEAGVHTVLENKDNLVLAGFIKIESLFREARKQFFGITQDVIEVPAKYVFKAKVSDSFVGNK
ncbi:HU family DNA-binding protein [Limosilactobacillus reuteri]|uniref:HU family DNA-binding protein n=1 Tax=Limosilactobacillus reuteri TaxID=1598 RepID=UPI001E5E12F8|nr:HU family DNA-binding protein [Limosilactobacillus reuteri]MCC4466857.1 HU family DNA-binding protein [Limosilactobacillus reuteri]MCC4472897.1 HU family DNA-binding protein [Limosilactobacillus reuteri]